MKKLMSNPISKLTILMIPLLFLPMKSFANTDFSDADLGNVNCDNALNKANELTESLAGIEILQLGTQ